MVFVRRSRCRSIRPGSSRSKPVFPQLDLLRAFLGGEPEEFEQTLVQELESFREYHAREEGQGIRSRRCCRSGFR
ncbi:hypothetical protein GCM10007079_06070 [Nocardiopsis terrae]|uniref:Uncharacterized protein n=1 Tax=Nocardiopsis terrae TaxID=372655 RepID=A0ABR9HNP4_9ACTN|nr:Imm49 family immunity protein [Nocardiopsis terrae]MBE1460655.1 hypothetical protein [Nocardiopsis terrae]GHC72684.1 hypothetical protein GCM10007079_06070 [Nocardiopsis terrae]